MLPRLYPRAIPRDRALAAACEYSRRATIPRSRTWLLTRPGHPHLVEDPPRGGRGPSEPVLVLARRPEHRPRDGAAVPRELREAAREQDRLPPGPLDARHPPRDRRLGRGVHPRGRHAAQTAPEPC